MQLNASLFLSSRTNSVDRPWHGLINYICRHQSKISSSKNFTCKVYLSEATSPPRFCLGWGSNFVGSESGQIQSVKGSDQ